MLKPTNPELYINKEVIYSMTSAWLLVGVGVIVGLKDCGFYIRDIDNNIIFRDYGWVRLC